MPVSVSSHEPVAHPSWILREWFQRDGRKQVELAVALEVSPKHLNQMLRGRAMWSVSMADRIEQVTGIPARQLMQLKLDYLLDLHARQR